MKKLLNSVKETVKLAFKPLPPNIHEVETRAYNDGSVVEEHTVEISESRLKALIARMKVLVAVAVVGTGSIIGAAFLVHVKAN